VNIKTKEAMKLTARRTHAFIEIKVDEISTTIFKSDTKEVEDTIANLLSIADDLANYTEKSIIDYAKELGY
jgi:hypothetical protein